VPWENWKVESLESHKGKKSFNRLISILFSKHMKGFVEFIREKGVVGLAVGFILGGAVSKLVTSFVTDIINPLLGIVLGLAKGLEGAYIKIGPAKVLYGHFISGLIDFLVIAFVVYFGVKIMKLDRLDKKKS